jgi:hypothetical protein
LGQVSRFATSSRGAEVELPNKVVACTGLNATAEEVIRWFVTRRLLEIAFEEAREHLGIENQRQ